MCAWVFFEGDAAREEIVGSVARHDGPDLCRNDGAHRLELHDELAADGLHGAAFVTKGDAVADVDGTSLNERVFHADDLLHRRKGLADLRWRDVLGAQV